MNKDTNIAAVFKISLLSLAVLILYFFLIPTSSAAIGDWYKDQWGIRTFVNSKAASEGFTRIPDGSQPSALNYDSVTARKICELAGFDMVVSYDCVSTSDGGRCGWYSCYDNGLAYWDSAAGNFINRNACSAGNKWIASLKCGNVVCSSNSDCGANGYIDSPFCQNNNVYQNYKTYACNNPGTSNSSCTNSTSAQLKQTCTGSQSCSGGSCVNITCSTNSDCGANGYIDSPFCQNNNVYQNYKTYACNNPGTSNSSCTNSTSAQLKQTCTGSQSCSNGSCGQNCAYHSYQQCSGNNLYWFDSCGTQQDLIQYCQNGCQNNACIQQNVTVQTTSATNIYNNQVTLNGYLNNYNSTNCSNYVWFQWGASASYGNETTRQNQNYTGSFSQNVNLYNSNYSTYHFRAAALLCSGIIVYGQDMTFTPGGSGGNLLTINKTVRNLTSGNSNWSNTAYANPSDMLMFMITIQANGNQNVNNVFVRDSFPANLIYKDQLVVACASNNSNYGNCNNSNYNYSGNITSGINLNTIFAGQTVTITYQAQVAGFQNFSYGTTILNNSVAVSSSGSGSNPVSNASISVTRSAVYGASAVATGLTDNLFVDSFVLPLLAALIGIWMFRSGMFIGVEKWVCGRKKTHSEYKAQKILSARINQIKQAERS